MSSWNLTRLGQVLMELAGHPDGGARLVPSVDEDDPTPIVWSFEHPRLRVWRSPHRFWWWRLTGPEGELLDDGAVPTWDEAMAVGLAAFEVASLTPSTQEQ